MTRLGYQIRLSLLSGIESALQILFVMVVLLPIRVVLNRLFARHGAFDWKVTFVIGGSITTLWYLAVCFSTFVDLRRKADRSRQLRQTFSASAFLPGLYGGTVILAAVLVVGTGREGDPVWVQLLPLTFILIAFYGWPRTSHCDADGVWQRTRFGLNRRIPYDETLSVAFAQGSMIVTGQHATIEHTPYHAGVERFQKILAKRSGVNIYYPER